MIGAIHEAEVDPGCRTFLEEPMKVNGIKALIATGALALMGVMAQPLAAQ